MHPPTILHTARLTLRPYQIEDSRNYLDFCIRNYDHLYPFEAGNPARHVKTLIQAETLLSQFTLDWTARVAFFYGAWVDPTPLTGKGIGTLVAQLYIGIVDWDLPEFEIGYVADVEYEGKGYVSEMVRAGVKMLFEDLNAHRIRIETNELNERSWRVAERCGFKREGHRRQTRKNPLMPDGSYSGDYLYGLLRTEFEQRK